MRLLAARLDGQRRGSSPPQGSSWHLPENGPACHRLAGAPVAAGASTGLGASPGTLGALSASGIAHKVARAHCAASPTELGRAVRPLKASLAQRKRSTSHGLLQLGAGVSIIERKKALGRWGYPFRAAPLSSLRRCASPNWACHSTSTSSPPRRPVPRPRASTRRK